MAGVYLHVPFCRRACTYCDFHFSTNLRRRDDMVEAMLRELSLRAGFFPSGTPLDSVYFGGGTPSVLSPAQVRALLDAVGARWPLREGAEVTLEANPDDLGPGVPEALRSAGVNRLSIGVQSFRDEDLRALNRSHDAAQAQEAVLRAQQAGFEDITLDLIYGLPGLDLAAWDANIAAVLRLDVPHVSAYALTVEKKTALAHQVRSGATAIPPDEAFAAQYTHLVQRLRGAGLDRYELSNFARPGWEALHNGAYWRGRPYLGIGPSAHSYDGQHRSWNHANNARYMEQVAQGTLPVAASELLRPIDRLNERIMTGLRTAPGIDLEELRRAWGVDLAQVEAESLAEFERMGWVLREGSGIRLSTEGFLVSDHIIASLFQVE